MDIAPGCVAGFRGKQPSVAGDSLGGVKAIVVAEAAEKHFARAGARFPK